MDNNHKLIGMPVDSYSGYDLPVIFLINLQDLGLMQFFVGFISLIYVVFRFLKQVKDEGGFKKYFDMWKELLNLFKPNGRDNEKAD